MLERFRRRATKHKRRPYRLFQIEPTLLCSLECVMCPWSEIRSQGGSMSWETFQRIADYLDLTSEVDFTGGGEPLKNPLLLEMIQYAKNAGCVVGFSTNGVMLTPHISEELVSLGLDWISFSIDAATPEVYERIRQGASFETVLDNIKYLRDIKERLNTQTPKMMMVFVMMTGSHENYQQLPRYVELAHSLGVEQIIAKNLDVILKDGDDERRVFSHKSPPQDRVSQILDQAQHRARQLGIGFRKYEMYPVEQAICEHDPIHNLYFNWEGYISPCITLSYAENRIFNGERILVHCLRFGNINQHKLSSIWDEPEYLSFRQIYENRINLQRKIAMDMMLGGGGEKEDFPFAPESCRTCYYLYGI
jgi:MoaA/NifB/PqqE/SkfB family radical SAM enzyme